MDDIYSYVQPRNGFSDFLSGGFSPETAMRQGQIAAHEASKTAFKAFEEFLGEGAAKKHPEAFAAFAAGMMQAAVTDAGWSYFCVHGLEKLENIASALDRDSLDDESNGIAVRTAEALENLGELADVARALGCVAEAISKAK